MARKTHPVEASVEVNSHEAGPSSSKELKASSRVIVLGISTKNHFNSSKYTTVKLKVVAQLRNK